jgi:hypothetical protein
MIVLVLFPLLFSNGCGGKEKTDQGRLVSFDKTNRTITLIRDKKADALNPDYSYLPPVTYTLAKDFMEKDLELKVGLRMKLDTIKNQIIIYDPDLQAFRTIKYNPLDKKENIAIENPLVFDTETKKPKINPLIDRPKKMITIYSRRQRILTTFTLPEKYFNLPAHTWDAGDDIRIFYKEEGKALRLLNITRIGFVRD